MGLFIGVASVEHINVTKNMGVIEGVTTYPSLIAKVGSDFNQIIRIQLVNK